MNRKAKSGVFYPKSAQKETRLFPFSFFVAESLNSIPFVRMTEIEHKKRLHRTLKSHGATFIFGMFIDKRKGA